MHRPPIPVSARWRIRVAHPGHVTIGDHCMSGSNLTRRTFLGRSAAVVGGVLAFPAVLQACASPTATTAPATAAASASAAPATASPAATAVASATAAPATASAAATAAASATAAATATPAASASAAGEVSDFGVPLP